MSFDLDSSLGAAFGELGWSAARPGSENEYVIGDYAHGFLLLQRPDYIQVARRTSRGEPALKMWTPNPLWAQVYVAFWTARLLRYRRGLPDLQVPVDPKLVDEAFRLEDSESTGAFLHATSTGDWAGFGRGNAFAAVAFSSYWKTSISEVLDSVLDAPGRAQQ